MRVPIIVEALVEGRPNVCFNGLARGRGVILCRSLLVCHNCTNHTYWVNLKDKVNLIHII